MPCFKQLEHNLCARMRKQSIALDLQRISWMLKKIDLKKKLDVVKGMKKRGRNIDKTAYVEQT